MTIEKLQQLAEIYNTRRFDKTAIGLSNTKSGYVDKFVDFVRLCELSEETEVKVKKNTCIHCDCALKIYYIMKQKVLLCPTCDVATDEDSGIVFLK